MIVDVILFDQYIDAQKTESFEPKYDIKIKDSFTVTNLTGKMCKSPTKIISSCTQMYKFSDFFSD